MCEHMGAVRWRDTTLLIWIHIVQTDHRFGLENARIIDHGRFKLERLVKGALHLGVHAVNRCVRLSINVKVKGHLHEETTCSREGITMSVYGHADGRSSHTRATIHRANYMRKGPDDGYDRRRRKQPNLESILSELNSFYLPPALNLFLSLFQYPLLPLISNLSHAGLAPPPSLICLILTTFSQSS